MAIHILATSSNLPVTAFRNHSNHFLVGVFLIVLQPSFSSAVQNVRCPEGVPALRRCASFMRRTVACRGTQSGPADRSALPVRTVSASGRATCAPFSTAHRWSFPAAPARSCPRPSRRRGRHGAAWNVRDRGVRRPME